MHGVKYNKQSQMSNTRLGGKKMWTYITDIRACSLTYRVLRSPWEKDNPMKKRVKRYCKFRENKIRITLRHTLRSSLIIRKRKLNHFHLEDWQKWKFNNSLEERSEEQVFSYLMLRELSWYVCKKQVVMSIRLINTKPF